MSYDDDTLIAERQEYERKLRHDKSNRIGLVVFLMSAWAMAAAVLYDSASGASPAQGGAVFGIAVLIVVSVCAVGAYLDSIL